MSKKQRKGYISITLKKQGANDIVIESCPEKIKLNFLQLYLAVGFGCPALNVKPIDWKGVATIFGSFFAPFVGLALFASMKLPGLGIIALIGLFVLNIVVTKNYFFNYIKKCISEGYAPESEENRVILSNAGILLPTQQNNVDTSAAKISKESTQTHSQPTRDFVQELEKLANLKEKGILTQEEFETQKQKLLNS